jgi:hypothetical protein
MPSASFQTSRMSAQTWYWFAVLNAKRIDGTPRVGGSQAAF